MDTVCLSERSLKLHYRVEEHTNSTRIEQVSLTHTCLQPHSSQLASPPPLASLPPSHLILYLSGNLPCAHGPQSNCCAPH